MEKDKLINFIDTALKEADNFVTQFYKGDKKPMLSTYKVLFLLRSEVKNNPNNINRRVLCAMHDISAISVKAYENTDLDTAIMSIVSVLYNDILEFRHLEPLGMDFGKGNPI